MQPLRWMTLNGIHSALWGSTGRTRQFNLLWCLSKAAKPVLALWQGYDIIEDMYSPKTSATNFVHELCTCRAKENLAPLLQLVTSSFDVFAVRMYAHVTHFLQHHFCDYRCLSTQLASHWVFTSKTYVLSKLAKRGEYVPVL